MALTLETVSNICQSFAVLFEDGCFGPNAMSTLLATSDDKVLVTNDGITILKSLHTSHPIGRMILQNVSTLHRMTGDHSKTFILMLAAGFRFLSQELSVKGRDHERTLRIQSIKKLDLSRLLLSSIYQEMKSKCKSLSPSSPEFLEDLKNVFGNILCSQVSFSSRQHLSDLVVQLVTTNHGLNSLDQVEDLIDHFDLICLESAGGQVTGSRLLKGFSLSRDFIRSPTKSVDNCKFVILSCPIDVTESKQKTVFSVKDGFEESLQFCHERVEKVCAWLEKSGVNLVISSVAVTDHVTSCLTEHGILVTHFVDSEECSRLALLCNIQVIPELRYLDQKWIGRCERLSYMLIGGSRRVFLEGLTGVRLNGSQLLLTAPTPGMCSQHASQVLNCLRVLRTMMRENNYHLLPCGAAFELYLVQRLAVDHEICVELLKACLLAIPTQLSKNAFSPSTLAELLSRRVFDDVTHVEPLAGKICLIQSFILCLQQILRLDHCLPATRRLTEKPSHEESE